MSTQPQNDPAELPDELRGWNWGAFLLSWIWGIGNNTFIALLALIPGVGFVMMVVLGLKGSEWAWRNNKWINAKHFRHNQRSWLIAGVAVWGAVIFLMIALWFGIQSIMKDNDAYRMTMSALRADDRVTELFGRPLEEGTFPMGSISIEGAGGEAEFSISISGPLAEGTAVSKAVKSVGAWELRYLAVRVEGATEPVVLIGE